MMICQDPRGNTRHSEKQNVYSQTMYHHWVSPLPPAFPDPFGQREVPFPVRTGSDISNAWFPGYCGLAARRKSGGQSSTRCPTDMSDVVTPDAIAPPDHPRLVRYSDASYGFPSYDRWGAATPLSAAPPRAPPRNAPAPPPLPLPAAVPTHRVCAVPFSASYYRPPAFMFQQISTKRRWRKSRERDGRRTMLPSARFLGCVVRPPFRRLSYKAGTLGAVVVINASNTSDTCVSSALISAHAGRTRKKPGGKKEKSVYAHDMLCEFRSAPVFEVF